MSRADALVAEITAQDLLASTGVTEYVFHTVFNKYCGPNTPIDTRYAAQCLTVLLLYKADFCPCA